MAKEKYISSTMAKITAIRNDKGISQQLFAEMNGWASKQSVCNYEYGITQPSIQITEAMLEKLGYHIEVVPNGQTASTKQEAPKPKKNSTVQITLTMPDVAEAMEVLSTINTRSVRAEIHETTQVETAQDLYEEELLINQFL